MATGRVTISPDQYDAVLFDMDGVITRTAEIHADAWKQLFDEYLNKKNDSAGYRPFDLKDDYVKHVDGKPRNEGVQSFIASRNIDIPYGSVNDTSDKETIYGLGNRKNQLFSELLKKKGVKVYESTLILYSN